MEKITQERLEEMYDELLDETKESWIQNYEGGSAFKEIDPTAYDVGLSDYEDSLSQDGIVVEGGEYDDDEDDDDDED